MEATENKKLKLTDELKILREKFHVIENSKAEKQRNISKLTPEESSLKFSIHELECIEYNSNSELGYLVRINNILKLIELKSKFILTSLEKRTT